MRICFYFQLHQPYRIEGFEPLSIGSDSDYFSSKADVNAQIFSKVANKSYRPMLSLLLELTQKYSDFYFSVSTSGVFLEQAAAFAPDVIELLRKLADTGQVEFFAETYYHSLAALYSEDEFFAQVRAQTKLLETLFGITPKTFRNTELIYSNKVAGLITQLGYETAIVDGVPWLLGTASPGSPARAKTQEDLVLLLKNAQLSDDIAFRFSDKNWREHPLVASTYHAWLTKYGSDELINLFMDFETFGEHQWADTGIFEFFAQLVGSLTTDSDASFVTPSQVRDSISCVKTLAEYDIHEPISWADVDRSTTAWNDNQLQKDTLSHIYNLTEQIKQAQSADPQEREKLLDQARRLQTSDHFYYMCTKWAADGDVHAYFSPFDSPYAAYQQYCVVLADFAQRVRRLKLVTTS